jgi:hypothetical protein
MAKELRIRRGTTAQHSTFTGAPNEVTADTTKKTLVLHDGTTVGGVPMARENLANVPAGSVATAMLADGAATTEKIADGAVTGPKLASGAAAANLGFTPANSAATVSLTGDQTVGGTKTFTNGVRFNDGTTQTTAASPAPSSFLAVGTVMYVINNTTSNYLAGSTIAGSNLLYQSSVSSYGNPASAAAYLGENSSQTQPWTLYSYANGTAQRRSAGNPGFALVGASALTGTWRILWPVRARSYSYDWYSNQSGSDSTFTLAVRIA